MEKNIAEQIIQEEDILSKDEKAILLEIYQQGEQKSHIFKFFERLRRVVSDTKIIYQESGYLGPNRDKVFGEMAI